jgi:hypothetical protein
MLVTMGNTPIEISVIQVGTSTTSEIIGIEAKCQSHKTSFFFTTDVASK